MSARAANELMPRCRCLLVPALQRNAVVQARRRYRKTLACKGHEMGEGNVCKHCGASQAEVLCEDNYRQDGR